MTIRLNERMKSALIEIYETTQAGVRYCWRTYSMWKLAGIGLVRPVSRGYYANEYEITPDGVAFFEADTGQRGAIKELRERLNSFDAQTATASTVRAVK